MTYQQFSVEEREKIQEGLWAKKSYREIARNLEQSPSSISREIQRTFPGISRRYCPRLAHERALEHRTHRGRKDRLKSESLREYVVSHLKLSWSPEQIAATAKDAAGTPISHERPYTSSYMQE